MREAAAGCGPGVEAKEGVDFTAEEKRIPGLGGLMLASRGPDARTHVRSRNLAANVYAGTLESHL